jgi:hypothetical protein
MMGFLIGLPVAVAKRWLRLVDDQPTSAARPASEAEAADGRSELIRTGRPVAGTAT